MQAWKKFGVRVVVSNAVLRVGEIEVSQVGSMCLEEGDGDVFGVYACQLLQARHGPSRTDVLNERCTVAVDEQRC